MAASNGYSPLASMGPQGRWRRVLLIALVPMVVVFLYYAYSSSLIVVPDGRYTSSAGAEHKSSPSHSVASHAAYTNIAGSPQSNTAVPDEKPHPTPTPTPTPTPEKEHEQEHEHEHEPVEAEKPPAKEEDYGMANVIKMLYTPILHPIDAMNFTDEDGDMHRLAGEPKFKEKLGKRVLILDIDSRPLTGEGQLMNKELKWKGMRPLSAGMLSHYMYAMIHGYDYKFLRAPDYNNRWGTWVKVPMMKHALKTHDYIVFMDSDVMFHYPHLPLEWLMNYWGMTDETLAMMSIDPDEPQNYDAKGSRYLNTGFVIARQSERTQEMYKNWAECPGETKYKGCKHWGLDWAHEQAAFGNYLRYDYDRPSDIKVLPCVEANGAPEAVNRGGCKGIFVRHFWVDKGLLSKNLAESVMQYFLPRLHQLYLETAEQHIENLKEVYKLDGADLVEMTEEERKNLKDDGKNQKDEGF